MSNKGHELILIPRIENPKVVDGALKTDLEDLTKAVNAQGGLKLSVSIDTNTVQGRLSSDMAKVQSSIAKTPLQTRLIADTKEAEAEVRRFIELQKDFKGFQISSISSTVKSENGKLTEDARVQLQLYNQEQQKTISLTYDYAAATKQIVQIRQTDTENLKAHAQQAEKSLQAQIKEQSQLRAEYEKMQNINIANTMKQMTSPLATLDPEYAKLKSYYTDLQKQSNDFLSRNKNGYDIWIEQEQELSKAFSDRLKGQMQAEVELEKQEKAFKDVSRSAEVYLSRIKSMESSWSAMMGNPEMVTQLNAIKEAFNTAKTKDDIQAATQQLQIFSNDVKAAGLNTKNFGDRISETFGRLSAYLVNVVAIGTITRAFKGALSDLKEIDDQLTQISKVTDLVRENFKQSSIEAIESANLWGRTATDYLEAVKTFAQAGATNYEDLANLSVLAQSAGDMTADLASDYLVATNAAFGLQYSVSELTKVLDGQNNISNKSAVTMTEMAMATKNYANTAAVAGESAASMSAMITAGVASTTKPGEEIGRALRTLSMNIRQIKGKHCPCVQKCA